MEQVGWRQSVGQDNSSVGQLAGCCRVRWMPTWKTGEKIPQPRQCTFLIPVKTEWVAVALMLLPCGSWAPASKGSILSECDGEIRRSSAADAATVCATQDQFGPTEFPTYHISTESLSPWQPKGSIEVSRMGSISLLPHTL